MRAGGRQVDVAAAVVVCGTIHDAPEKAWATVTTTTTAATATVVPSTTHNHRPVTILLVLAAAATSCCAGFGIRSRALRRYLER